MVYCSVLRNFINFCKHVEWYVLQLHDILPHSQGVRDDTVHLGNNAELTLEAPPEIRLGRTANYMNMAIYKHNQVGLFPVLVHVFQPLWFIHSGRAQLRDRYRLHEIVLLVGLGQYEHLYSFIQAIFFTAWV